MNFSAPKELLEYATGLVRQLQHHGYSAYFAGGCVRDALLNRSVHDIDIATSATPDEILCIFPSALPVGKAFGVMLLKHAGLQCEIATFRKDHSYSDGRHPDNVTFTSDAEDALRRDFTINGLFYDPVQNRLIDHVNGLPDLKAGTIRAIGSPRNRFLEDALRLLRAVRFAAVLDFDIENDTYTALCECASEINRISRERIAEEFIRILTESPRAGDSLACMLQTGLLHEILPEIEALHGVQQPPIYHPEGDVFEHTRLMLNAMPPHPSAELALSVLLHDVGKPATYCKKEHSDGTSTIHFHGHETEGSHLAGTILRRLKQPSKRIQTTQTVIRNHMKYLQIPRMKISTIRRLIYSPTYRIEKELHKLDCMCSNGYRESLQRLDEIEAAFPCSETPWITGDDLKQMGLTSGPDFGKILDHAYTLQLSGLYSSKAELLRHIERGHETDDARI